jgi:hypothetical protein
VITHEKKYQRKHSYKQVSPRSWSEDTYAQVELLVIDRTGSGYPGANLISTKTEEREGWQNLPQLPRAPLSQEIPLSEKKKTA